MSRSLLLCLLLIAAGLGVWLLTDDDSTEETYDPLTTNVVADDSSRPGLRGSGRGPSGATRTGGTLPSGG